MLLGESALFEATALTGRMSTKGLIQAVCKVDNLDRSDTFVLRCLVTINTLIFHQVELVREIGGNRTS